MTKTLPENRGNAPEEACPKCKSYNFEFGALESCDTGIFYPVKCTDCGFTGQQHYNVAFSCFTNEDGKEVNLPAILRS